MKKLYLPVIILFSFNLLSQTKILSADSKLIKLFDGGFFTEGPAAAQNGDLYFSDLTFTDASNMQAGIIWKFEESTGLTSVYRSPSGMANGISFGNSGNIIVCEGADYGGRKITSTDLSSGKSKIITGLFNGLPYNSPNDLVIDKSGRIYFTDPRYSGWEKIEQPCFGVYRIDTNGKVNLIISDIPMPNGIVISPDEKKLFVGCNFEGDAQNIIPAENSIFIYDLDQDGNVSNGKRFIKFPDDFGPDGIEVDNSGNLYVALRDESNPGVYVYNNRAEQIESIPLPEVPSNLTFSSGTNKNILYIAAGRSVYKINISTEGIH